MTIRNKHPNNYWNKERCSEAAKSCQSRSEFCKRYNTAYLLCLKKGWLDEICSHMKSKRRSHKHWDNKDNVIEAISQCDTEVEFHDRFNGAYRACRANGWREELFVCLSKTSDKVKYQTVKDIELVAAKYSTQAQFAKHDGSAYNAAHRKGILERVCQHMVKHFQNVEDLMSSCNTDDSSMSFNEVFECARRCSDFTEFRKSFGHAYISAIRNEWIDVIAQMIPCGARVSTKEIFEKVKTCKKYSDFTANYKHEYNEANALGEYSSVKHHFVRRNLHYGDISFEYISSIAKQCDSYADFRINYPKLYSYAQVKGWLSQIAEILPKKAHNIYTKEEIIELSKKYQSRKDFMIYETSAYNAARHNGWLAEIDTILPRMVRKPYDKEQILSIAQSCATYSDFIKLYRYAYIAARNKGLIDEVKELFTNNKNQQK